MSHWLYDAKRVHCKLTTFCADRCHSDLQSKVQLFECRSAQSSQQLIYKLDEVLDAMLCFRCTSSRYRRQRFALECLCLKFIYVSYFVIFVLFVCYQWSKGYCVFLNRNRGQYFLFWTFCAGFYSKAASIFLLKVFVLNSVPNGHSNLSTVSDKKSKH